MWAEPASASPPAWQVTLLIGRRSVRAALPIAAIFSVFIAVSAWGYAITYRTFADRVQLATSFGANAGIDAILGPARHIDTVGGFTAWRCLGVLSVVGGVWGLLTATRLLRGEEDAGRWELLLGGATTRGRAAAQALAGLFAAAAVVWAVPAVATVLVGRAPRVHFSASASLWLVFATASSAAMFLAVGACTAQLCAARRPAAGYAGLVLGISYALRMAADSGAGLSWLRWTTPLGWVEELRPMSDPRPIAVLPIAALIAACAGAAIALGARRDLGASVLGRAASRRSRTYLLGGPTGLATRLTMPTALGWIVGIALGGMLIGLVSKSAGTALTGSAALRTTLSRLGAHGVGAQAYLGVAFLPIALLVSLLAATQISAAHAEEADGRLEHLLDRPVSRTRWLLGRATIAVGGVLAAGQVAALGTWLGAATQHAGVGLPRLLGAGANVTAPALVVVGVGVLAIGVRPRAAGTAVYALLVWSFLAEIIGSVAGANHWLLDTSLFHHITAAPAVDPNWTTDLVLVAVAVLLGALGAMRFARRDIL